MKKVYKKLLKIKNPVLIEVVEKEGWMGSDRYRILYPDGTCQWVLTYVSHGDFTKKFKQSCFTKGISKNRRNLKTTVSKMMKFDDDRILKIKKFVEIK